MRYTTGIMKGVYGNSKAPIQGFTIVELLIVIVIIGILAVATFVSYGNIQEKASFSTMQADLSAITRALALYRVDNDGYPSTIGQSGCTSNWCGWDQATGDNFITGLSPKYIAKIPQLPTSYVNNNTYLYQSDGVDYQLIRFNPAGLTNAELTNNPLLATTDGYNGIAWGHRTYTASWW